MRASISEDERVLRLGPVHRDDEDVAVGARSSRWGSVACGVTVPSELERVLVPSEQGAADGPRRRRPLRPRQLRARTCPTRCSRRSAARRRSTSTPTPTAATSGASPATTTSSPSTATTRTFSSWRGGTIIDDAAGRASSMARMIMLNMDPPEHTKLRKIVNKGFTPRMIRELMEHLRTEAAATSSTASPSRASSTSSTEVAAELPLIAIAEMLGVPVEERQGHLRPVEPAHRLRRPRVPDLGRGRRPSPRPRCTPSPRSIAAHKRSQPGRRHRDGPPRGRGRRRAR